MTATLFPYTELQGNVGLTVTAVRLNGATMSWETTDADNRIVELRNPDQHSWSTGEIDLTVTGPAAELEARSDTVRTVRAVAVLDCGPTNRRQAIELTPAAGSTWTGTFELDRSDWSGNATLSATIVATIDDVDDRCAGFASTWTVRLDDLPPREINNAMRVLWENFAEPTEQRSFLTEYADDICFLRIDPAQPLLFLNSGFAGLRALLEEKPGRPREHRLLREQVLTDLAATTWHALFTAALEAIEKDDEGHPGLPAEDWQRNVLDALLPRMYPNISIEEARRDAWENRHDRSAAAGLQERLLPAVSQHVLQPKTLREAIRAFNDQQQEDQ
jgi:hypothetical protein